MSETAYNLFSKNTLLGIYDAYSKTHVRKYYNFFNKTQYWNLEQLTQFQTQRLKVTIQNAYTNVPYYRRLFREHNLLPTDIKSADDLRKLPVLTKDIVRDSPKDFLAKNIPLEKVQIHSTSGSTGKVFTYYIDKQAEAVMQAIGMRGWGYAGYNIGDKIVTIAGSSLLSTHLSRLKKLRFRVSRNLPLSSYNLDDVRMAEYVQKVMSFNPEYIRGYPSSLELFARYLLDHNSSLHLKAAMTTAESLSQSQRKIISEALNCPVYDQWGCADGGAHACECQEHSGYHISMDRAVHEFLGDDAQPVLSGETGHVILTDLWNSVMPLIRYDAGDLAVPTDEICPCGRGLPLIIEIKGRNIERIVKRNWQRIPGLTFTDVFENDPLVMCIHDYQIIQEQIDLFTVFIVPAPDYKKEYNDLIQKWFNGHMGEEVTIDFKFVDEIPRTEANKRRIVISKVDSHPEV